MALSRGASDPEPDPGDIRPLKPCLLSGNNNRDQHCVAASCLEELRRKACEVLAINESLTPVTLVLADDGTIVDDDDYFLCLPSNTKFVALACNEKGAYNNSDGGTAWVSQESFDVDETDSGAWVKWKDLARMLKEDLSNIILSEEELEVLIDIRCSELARELCQSCATVQRFQDELGEALDKIEMSRQFKQMLELYHRAKEGAFFSNQEEPKAALGGEVDAVDTGISKETASEVALTSQILTVLKEKPAPELSLSSQDLELVSKEDPRALAVALSGDIKKAETVQRACSKELALCLELSAEDALHQEYLVRRIHCLRNSRAPNAPDKTPSSSTRSTLC